MGFRVSLGSDVVERQGFIARCRVRRDAPKTIITILKSPRPQSALNSDSTPKPPNSPKQNLEA